VALEISVEAVMRDVTGGKEEKKGNEEMKKLKRQGGDKLERLYQYKRQQRKRKTRIDGRHLTARHKVMVKQRQFVKGGLKDMR